MRYQRGDASDAVLLLVAFICILLFWGEPDLWDRLLALLDSELEIRGVELPVEEGES